MRKVQDSAPALAVALLVNTGNDLTVKARQQGFKFST